MLHLWLALLALFSTVAHAAPPERVPTELGFAWMVKSWQGSSVGAVLEAWGTPDRTFEPPGRGVIYIYDTRRTEVTPRETNPRWAPFIGFYGSVTTGGEEITFECKVMLEVSDRHVVWTKYEGNDCFYVAPAWLGTRGRTYIRPDGARGPRAGVLVEKLARRGAAERAGIRPGDIVVAVGGKRVTSEDALDKRVDAYSAGVEVPVVFTRDGKRKKVWTTLRPPPFD